MASPAKKKTFATEASTEVKSQAVRLAISGLFKKTKGSEKDVNVLDWVLSLCGDNDTLWQVKFFYFEKKKRIVA